MRAGICYRRAMQGTTIAYEVFGKTGVLVHAAQQPASDEWETFIGELRGNVLEKKKLKGLVVYSAGGAPTDNQRTALTNLTRFHNVPTAIILEDHTDFIDAGGCVVSGLNWTGDLNEATYSPEQLSDAVISLKTDDQDAVLAALQTLRAELGDAPS